MIYKGYDLDFHYTGNGHCYIGSCIGGYVETSDSGRYYHNMRLALNHRVKDIKRLHRICAEDNEAIVMGKTPPSALCLIFIRKYAENNGITKSEARNTCGNWTIKKWKKNGYEEETI